MDMHITYMMEVKVKVFIGIVCKIEFWEGIFHFANRI